MALENCAIYMIDFRCVGIVSTETIFTCMGIVLEYYHSSINMIMIDTHRNCIIKNKRIV